MKMKQLIVVLSLFMAMIEPSLAQPVQGTTPRKIIGDENRIYMRPQWSPDGSKIAFTSEKNRGIWISNAKGNKISQVTDDSEAGFGFLWSADSKTILARPVVVENDRRFHQIKTYNSETLEARVILDKTRKLQSMPVWSNNDTEVTFLIDNNVEKRSSGLSPLKSASKDIPGVVAFGNTFKSSAKPAEPIEFERFKNRYIFNIRTSPNGEKMAFQVNGLGMFICNTDGSGLKSLGFTEQASWMPDNRYIVATKVEDNGIAITSGEIVLIDTETASQFTLLNDSGFIALNPSVSPDGDKVLFENLTDGAIYLMPLK
jgi:Tol biopolymer transport system component